MNVPMRPLLALLFVFAWIVPQQAVLGQKNQCGNTTTYCLTSCCAEPYSPTGFGCSQKTTPAEDVCCKPGPELEPSTDRPNCLVIGDSISIGYTPIAAQLLPTECLVQHGPWDVADGGAGDVAYGLACLESFLHTQRQTPVAWDVILFNFGLHNLEPHSPEGLAAYREALWKFTWQLSLRMPQAQLLFATTTPYMKDKLQNNSIVEELNAVAVDLLQHEIFVAPIEIVDLYSVVTDHCGAEYENCDFCDQSPCDMHYTHAGYTALGQRVAEAMRSRLPRRRDEVPGGLRHASAHDAANNNKFLTIKYWS